MKLLKTVAQKFFKKNQSQLMLDEIGQKKETLVHSEFDQEESMQQQRNFESLLLLLGNDDSFVRVGAVYSLFEYTQKDKEFKHAFAKIVSALIRKRTQQPNYVESHADRPSEEIQTYINLLFRNVGNVIGIYTESSLLENNFPHADLSRSYLCGADFEQATCENVSFLLADCRKVNFQKSILQGSNFFKADCREANFSDTRSQRTAFRSADCRNAKFDEALFQVADFENALCQQARFYQTGLEGAFFKRANCQDANFDSAHCEVTVFSESKCYGANFQNSKCLGGNFRGSHCQGVNLSNANLQGAIFNQANLQGAILINAECQAAKFIDSHCQGADFSHADLSSVEFLHTALQGSRFNASKISETNLHLLDDEVYVHERGKMLLKGLIEPQTMECIENAKPYLSNDWYEVQQKIIKDNVDKAIFYGIPDRKHIIIEDIKDSVQLTHAIEMRVNESVKRYSSF